MEIRIFGIAEDSIVDGPGLRLAVFTQGCPHHCPGCHNPDSHDPEGGRMGTTEEILEMLDDNPLLDGITLSGGEPFLQPEPCRLLAEATHERGLNVWCYTGYTYEALLGSGPAHRALLDAVDVLVDGPFVLEKRSLELKFRGSSNQRLIDVPASLKAGNVVLWGE